MAKRGCQTPCFSVSELRNDTEKQDVCAAPFINDADAILH
jgi:hypothetical protein